MFNEFLKAFIVTHSNKSFYLDLDGNYDLDYQAIIWSSEVLEIHMAKPYILACLESHDEKYIELRNIFAPNLISQKILIEGVS